MNLAALEPGSHFGGYRIIELLGRGGMGAVDRAQDERLGRFVALKLILSTDSKNLVRRFEREGRAALAIVHPNVTTCFDVGEAGGVPFLALELVAGGTLKSLLKANGALPPREAAALCAQVARGLAAIHAAGLVHRDQCPMDDFEVAGMKASDRTRRAGGWDRDHSDGHPFTSPVGSFPAGASPRGALDMAGNVWQWCEDWFDDKAYARYARGDAAPPPRGTDRVVRGGSWQLPRWYCRSSLRAKAAPDVRHDTYGFRASLRSPTDTGN